MMAAVMDLDFSSALVRECPSCLHPGLWAEASCQACGISWAREEEFAFDFMASDDTHLPPGYVPLYNSPHLKALREAARRREEPDYEARIHDVLRRVLPHLRSLEAHNRRSGWPEDVAVLMAESVTAYSSYCAGIELMLDDADYGLQLATDALADLDRLEKMAITR